MNCCVQVRSRPHPYGGLTHITILFSILTRSCVTNVVPYRPRYLLLAPCARSYDVQGCEKMRSAAVVESQNFLFSECSPLASHASTEHDLEAFQWRCSCKRAARVFWCQLAHSLGILRDQPCSDERIPGITLVRVDPSCPDGSQSKLVQITHKNFMVDS